MAKLQSVNSVAGKETLYVDVDDEITAIIDKVTTAKSKVVALVLPKRCPVLQSVVNMKLLKRTADRLGKNLVLVTSEAGLMPLAGATGLHVASTPSSKPSIPDAPTSVDSDGPEEIEGPLSVVDGNAPEDDDFDTKAAAGTAVGELAAAGTGAKAAKEQDIDESIDMNDPEDVADKSAEDANTMKAVAKKTPKVKKDKSLHVPNFDTFRKKLFIGVLVLILLIALWIVAFKVLPKATVNIGTDSSTIPTNLTLSLDTTANSLNTSSYTVPAVSQSQQKTATATVPATGQQNNGQKASGQVTLALTDCNSSTVTIPTGSGLTSGSLTYITQGSVTLQSVQVGHSCNPSAFSNLYSATVTVEALNGGSNYNIPNGSGFTVPSSVSGASDVSGQASSTISGGTDNITTIVQQSDITNATNKIASANTSTVKQEIEQSLEAKGLQPVPVTFLTGTPQVSSSVQAGTAASNVTVTSETSYSMLGVNATDLKTLVDSNVNSRIDKGKQVILSDGVSSAQFAEANPGTATSATVAMTTKSLAGPQINTNSLKSQLVGMKSQDVQSYLKQTPGVTNVSVKYSPFWVDAIPKNAKKVTITVEKAGS